MLRETPLTDILFLDIETIPAYPNWAQAPEVEQELWKRKSSSLFRNEERSPEDSYERAGIYAEFGKVICISCGRFRNGPQNEPARLEIRSFIADSESNLLNNFIRHIQKSSSRPLRLCAHNGKEFDFPYLSRRLLINNIELPRLLDNAGKKPWEIPHFDTLELWKFGDYKHYTSLETLAHVFGIPSPKTDMNGADVANAWYQDGAIERIRNYCEQDVVTLTHVFLKMRQKNSSPSIIVEYCR